MFLRVYYFTLWKVKCPMCSMYFLILVERWMRNIYEIIHTQINLDFPFYKFLQQIMNHGIMRNNERIFLIGRFSINKNLFANILCEILVIYAVYSKFQWNHSCIKSLHENKTVNMRTKHFHNEFEAGTRVNLF